MRQDRQKSEKTESDSSYSGIDNSLYSIRECDFDKPLKLTPHVPKMIGAPSDYNEEMEKYERELEKRKQEK